MIRVLVRKENREQAMTAVALLILGVGVLFGLFVWRSGAPGDQVGNNPGDMWPPLILAWLCGLVAGAQTLAGEYENSTMAWLDALPVSRRRIWRGKAVAALFILGWQTALLIGLAAHFGYFRMIHEQLVTYPLTTAVPFVAVPLIGLAFGLFGSAAGRTPMAAIGWALLGQMIWVPALMIVAGLIAIPIRNAWPTDLLLIALAPAAPLLASYWLFSRLDRMRRRLAIQSATGPGSWRVLLWLAWRQVRWFHAVILIAGLLTASFLPRTEPLGWPFFGLVFGAVLGVSVFAPDQLGGAVRFLGERRLPLGRLWLNKTAVALAPLVVIITVFLLNAWLTVISRMSTGRDEAAVWQQLGFDRVVTPTTILLCPVYGFAVGQFFGLVCRKGAVAAVLTLLTAGGLLAVWAPSMIAGGLVIWQWLMPPLVLIAASWLLMRPWVAGRLSDWRPAWGIAAAGLLALGGIAFGLGCRATEFPAGAQPFDPVGFLLNPPSPEQREASRKMQLAANQFDKFFNKDFDPTSYLAASRSRAVDKDYSNRAFGALTSGWPAADPQLNAWMDRAFSGEWLKTLREAAALPPAAVRFSESGGSDTPYLAFWHIRRLLCARGLQLQARGEHGEAFAMFRLAFDAERRLRFRTLPWNYLNSVDTERLMLQGLSVWAGNAGDQSEYLREAVRMLRENELALPPLVETIEAGYKDATSRVQRFLPGQLAPWEWERWNRVVNWLFAGWKRTATLDYRTAVGLAAPPGTPTPPSTLLEAWVPPLPQADVARDREKLRRAVGGNTESLVWWISDEMFSEEFRTLACWRAARLQIALLLFEHEHGKPAERLADLVPTILPELPLDPFNGEQFRYRVSKGEHIFSQLIWPFDRGDEAAPGQGVIWSVSTNLVDDGGVKNGGYFQGFGLGPPGLDLIFLVPRPAKK